MLDNWLDKDDTIDLLKLFGHFGYDTLTEKANYTLFKRENRYRVVIFSEEGFLYYHVESPEKKLSASHLIVEQVSRIEGPNNEGLWDKVDSYYNEVLRAKEFLYKTVDYAHLKKVPRNFNHFLSYAVPFKEPKKGLYADLPLSSKFRDKLFTGEDGEPIFPLVNIQNENTGYWTDGKNGMGKLGESDMRYSLWHSGIPENIAWLMVFKDPKEAIAFHKKFALDNAVYLALGALNHETAKILFQIHRSTRVKKIILSFTGLKKIEGYLRDLHFISLMDDSNFMLKTSERDIRIRFRSGEDKSFLRFYNSIKKFNQGLAKSLLQYAKVMDQLLINRHSIMIGKDGDTINMRIPLEVNAIKYFVWSYYKNYLGKSIEILKPKRPNWVMEWESDESIPLKGKEVQLEDYRIAL